MPLEQNNKQDTTKGLADSLSSDTLIQEVPVNSLFAGHELQAEGYTMIEKTNLHSTWITLLLMGCVIIVAYLRAVYSKRFTDFFRAVADMRFASQLVREERVLSQRTSVLLSALFFITSTMYLFLVVSHFNIPVFSGSGFVLFLKIGLGVLLIFIFKLFIFELTGFVFNAQNECSFYNFHIFILNQALGLTLIPVITGIIFIDAFPTPVFIYTGIFFYATAYSVRLIRGLKIGMSKQGFNKLYLFFYFCTLEILPAALLAKLILKHSI